MKKQIIRFYKLLILFFFVFFTYCKKESNVISKKFDREVKTGIIIKKDISLNNESAVKATKQQPLLFIQNYNDTTFVRLDQFSKDFVYDMKYATKYNFIKKKVYDCAECYLRAKTVKALLEANKELMRLNYRIKLFDCYRPLDVQKKMWNILPHTNYVASPGKGSIHNRGGAVDITLVDKEGNELEMGTPFDYFGREAHHDYKNLPEKILKNRKLLKGIMLKHNFRSINTEWWHYNLIEAKNYSISNFRWSCK